MNKPVRIVLLDNAKAEFEKLNQIAGQQATAGRETSEEMQLLKSIKQKIEFIRQNPFLRGQYKENSHSHRI